MVLFIVVHLIKRVELYVYVNTSIVLNMWLFQLFNHNNYPRLKLCLVTFCALSTLRLASGSEWYTDDSVIVEPETDFDYEQQPTHDDSREDRQFFVQLPSAGHPPHYPIGWPLVTSMAQRPMQSNNGDGNGFGSCTTTRGESGYCATLRQCFPALYTNTPDEYDSTSGYSATMMKDTIRNPGLADLLRSISGNCKAPVLANQFYFRTDAQLLRQNLICCSNQQMNQPSVVNSRPSQSTTMKSIPLKYPSRPKIPIGFGGHRPPIAAVAAPAQQPPSYPSHVETTTEGYLVESSCGVPKIVGGNETYDGKYPWVVALLNGQKQICGGSLIDNKFVLTASHCVGHMKGPDVARLRVLLGAHNIHQINQGAVVKKISKLMRHRGFSHRTLHNDIAILKLESPVKFTNKISPICLAQSDNTRYENTQAIVAGWGSVSEYGAQPKTLREVTLDIWTNAQCKNKYGHLAPGGITDHMMCAGSPDRDACRGDSGGPLMSFDGRKYSQIGLVSWGIGCGRFPGVYSRISDFKDWIDKQREL